MSMTTREAIAKLTFAYPDRHISIAASLTRYSLGRVEHEITVYVGGPNGTSGENHSGCDLESLVRLALSESLDSERTEAVIDELAQEAAK